MVYNKQAKSIGLTGVFLCLAFAAASQPSFSYQILQDSVVRQQAKKFAMDLYHAGIGDQQGLRNGRLALVYPYPFDTGTPFYDKEGFSTGSVRYDNMLYTNQKIQFDNLAGVLNVMLPEAIIELNPEKTDSFSFRGHQFLRIHEDSLAGFEPGFYEVLYSGSHLLLESSDKLIEEQPGEDLKLHRFVRERKFYWVKRGKQFYSVQNKSDLLNIFSDKKREVETFLRKNGIKLRRDRRAAFTATSKYYDQIIR